MNVSALLFCNLFYIKNIIYHFLNHLENEHSIHIGDIFGLKSLYRYRYDRKNLRATLKEKLESEHFARDADKPNFEQVVANVVEAAFNKFTDLAEFRLFVRRVDKLLPESVDNVILVLYCVLIQYRLYSPLPYM